MTVGELHLHSIRLAKSLQFDGVVAGDVIGLCSENRAEFPVVLFAAFLLGATVAPLNTTYIEGIQNCSCPTFGLNERKRISLVGRRHLRLDFLRVISLSKIQKRTLTNSKFFQMNSPTL